MGRVTREESGETLWLGQVSPYSEQTPMPHKAIRASIDVGFVLGLLPAMGAERIAQQGPAANVVRPTPSPDR
jgi:hypothetical protein